MVVYHATIIPCDGAKYDVYDEHKSYETQLSDALTPEEYVCFRNLLMKIVTKRDRHIFEHHTIKISHNVEY